MREFLYRAEQSEELFIKMPQLYAFINNRAQEEKERKGAGRKMSGKSFVLK